MGKVVDLNGYWAIKSNPITKEGVFPYMGYQISDELEPNKIYYVYRPASEITSDETIESFDGVPLIDEHEMLGDGFTEYDKRPGGGFLYHIQADGNMLVGDLKIFSETIKDEIENGKKELSLGYRCQYDLTSGEFNGEHYDAIQRNLRGNHIALVKNGRMGHEVRVYDSAKLEQRFTMDEMPIIDSTLNASEGNCSELTDGDDTMELIEKIGELLKAEMSADDKLAKIAELLGGKADEKPAEEQEKSADQEESKADETKAEESKDEESEEKPEEKSEETKDEEKAEETKDADEKDEPETKDEAKEEDLKEDDKSDEKSADECESKVTGDSMRAVLKEFSLRESIKKEVEPLIGSFSCDDWNADEVAKYACDKLGLGANLNEAQAVLRGYMAGKNADRHFGMDSAPVEKAVDRSMDLATINYLKG